MSSIAWYSDLSVQFKPVSSGYRLMAFYKLFDKSRRVVCSSSVYAANKMKFEQLLRLWREKVDTRKHSKKFILLLDQKGTSHSSHPAYLEGPNSLLVQRLHSSCSSNGFHVFLARMKRVQRAPAGDQYGYDSDRHNSYKQPVMTLKKLYTCDGRGQRLAAYSSLSELDIQDILQPDPFSAPPTSTYAHMSPFPVDYDDPPLVLQRYIHQVVVLIPTENLLTLITPPSFATLLGTVCERTITDPTNPGLRTTALNMIDWALESRVPEKDCFFEVAVRWCLSLEDNYLLIKATNSGITNEGGNAAFLLEIVANHKEDYADLEQPDWQQSLGAIASGIRSLQKLQNCLREFGKELEAGLHQTSFEIWSHSIIDDHLTRRQTFRLADSSAVCWMLQNRDPDWIDDLRLLLDIMLNRELVKPRVLRETYQHIVSQNAKFLTSKTRDLEQEGAEDKIKDVLSILETAIDLGLHAEVISVLRKSIANIEADHGYTPNHIAVLRTVSEYIKLGKKYESLLDPVSRDLTTILLERAIRECMEEIPPQQSDWSRKDKGCGCSHCEKVVEFLAEPEEESKEFSFTTQEVEHIFERINKAHFELKGDKFRPYKKHALITFRKTTFQYDRRLMSWKGKFDRLREAWKPLQEESTYLKRLLGKRYQELVLLLKLRACWHEKAQHLKSAPTEADHATGTKVPKMAMKKRKKSGFEHFAEWTAARGGTTPAKRIVEPPVHLGF
ncbi:hypothetical protein FKW77_007674 [Venturia effusa]|uniref:Uncharacterized protein n=1 Tax=Venturia effusa TaxID=50376 RepID=A0A517LCP9_9PEZI|nr:hypothetical protein FKW77_007674 [Venturia effusa]